MARAFLATTRVAPVRTYRRLCISTRRARRNGPGISLLLHTRRNCRGNCPFRRSTPRPERRDLSWYVPADDRERTPADRELRRAVCASAEQHQSCRAAWGTVV